MENEKQKQLLESIEEDRIEQNQRLTGRFADYVLNEEDSMELKIPIESNSQSMW